MLRIPSDEITLIRFPEECLDLPGLRRVGLFGHALTELPAGIAVLAERDVVLDVRRNPIRRLPSGPLPRLVIDTLQHRHLGPLLPISAIHGLQVLDRHWDAYRERLAEFPHLRELSLESVGLSTLPPEIAQLDYLYELGLDPEHMNESQRATCEAGLDALLLHLRRELDQRDGAGLPVQAKVILLGHGGAGKTTLLHRLLDPDYQLRKLPSTHGINTEDWPIGQGDSGPEILAHVWDFGGQELHSSSPRARCTCWW